MKIDKRRTYICDLDTETANTMTNPDGSLNMEDVLMYDCGWQIMDKHNNVYLQRSYVNADIFLDEKKLMQSAYYAKKNSAVRRGNQVRQACSCYYPHD